MTHGAKSPPKVAGVVLAAGRSRRMGRENKLLQDVDGQPMICRAVDAFLGARLESVVVVTGHESQLVASALDNRSVSLVVNDGYLDGMGSSLRAGTEALPDGLDAVVVGLGDMPWVRPEHIDALIGAFEAADPPAICVPVHEGKRGNPVLWPARYFEELKSMAGDVGARPLLARHAASVLGVEVGDSGVVRDVDTPDASVAGGR